DPHLHRCRAAGAEGARQHLRTDRRGLPPPGIHRGHRRGIPFRDQSVGGLLRGVFRPSSYRSSSGSVLRASFILALPARRARKARVSFHPMPTAELKRWARLAAWLVLSSTVDRLAARGRPATRKGSVLVVRLDDIGDFVLWQPTAARLQEL